VAREADRDKKATVVDGKSGHRAAFFCLGPPYQILAELDYLIQGNGGRGNVRAIAL
jgi:hypothetical protein